MNKKPYVVPMWMMIFIGSYNIASTILEIHPLIPPSLDPQLQMAAKGLHVFGYLFFLSRLLFTGGFENELFGKFGPGYMCL